MGFSTRSYYSFLGFHSFLIGLLPFFLPVIFYKNGASLDVICYFIGVTGFSFAFCLYLFDRFRSGSARLPILLSFIFELLLLLGLVLNAPWQVIAVLNGGYSCLYWTIQRIFFLSGGCAENSGRRFGNFQIYILISLKVGILTGSALLENFGVWAVCFLSLTIISMALWSLLRKSVELTFPAALTEQPRLTLQEILGYKDRYNSRMIFWIDGVFLYLESYFWVITLFLFVGESFVRLGSVVVGLALFLGIVFYIIKNRIDRIDNQRLYIVGTILYVLSWGLRGGFGFFGENSNLVLQMCLIILISFFTSFFRLTFNKIFFDLAESTCSHKYLLIKSYHSQIGLGIVFVVIGFVTGDINSLKTLTTCYWVAAAIAFFYFLFRYDRGHKKR